MGTREESLLWALPVAVVASVLIAWLILRSVFRHDHPAKLVSASILVVLYPYAVLLLYAIVYAISPVGRFDQWYVRLCMLIALAFASAVIIAVLWFMLFVRRSRVKRYKEAIATALVVGICLVAWKGQVSAEDLGDSFTAAAPVVLPGSFAVALLILRSMFQPEDFAKAVFASVLIAHLACTLPLFDATMNDVSWADSKSFYLWYLIVETLFLAIIFIFPTVILVCLWGFATVRHSLSGERTYKWEASIALLLGAWTIWWVAGAMWWTTFDKL